MCIWNKLIYILGLHKNLVLKYMKSWKVGFIVCYYCGKEKLLWFSGGNVLRIWLIDDDS